MRLSTLGRTLAIATPTLLVASIAADYPELLYLAATGVVALGIAVAAVTWRSMGVAAASSHLPHRVDPPLRAIPTLQVTPRRPRVSLQLVVGINGTTHRLDDVVIDGGDGRSVEVRTVFPALGRGEHVVGPVDVRITDPLELVRRDRRVAEARTVLVRPVRHAMPSAPRWHDRDLEGAAARVVLRGGQVDDGVREYETGDDLRLVHVPASRRHDAVMVRHRVVADTSGLVVVLDTSAAAYADDDAFEGAVSVAASLCAAGADGDVPLTLSSTGRVLVRSHDGRSALDPALDALARVSRRDDDAGLARLPVLCRGVSQQMVVVVTGNPALDRLGVVATVAGRVPLAGVIGVGWRGGPPARLGGRFIGAPDGAAAVHRWNRLVARR
jgi:uncharacterized protein (DUF58 family)